MKTSHTVTTQPYPLHRSKYPFATMKVGQCFAVAAKDYGKVNAAAGRYSRTTGRRFSLRTVDGQTACWRIA